MNHRLSVLLREARQKSGLTQEDVASRVGLKKNTLSNYEHGVSEPSLDTLVSLFCIYGLDPAYVFSVAYGTPLREGILTAEEETLLDQYRALDTHGKSVLMELARMETKRMEEQRLFWADQYARIAARSGGVGDASPEEREELAALYSYLKEEGRLP